MSEIQKNGGNLQQQQLQQLVQFQALNIFQSIQQQQQQSVPLPSNTTLTPVARQNMQSLQKQTANYPRANLQNKNVAQNLNANTVQPRKILPNTLKPMYSPATPTLNASAVTPKGFMDNSTMKPIVNVQSTNLNASLTITKTNSPSSSTAKNIGGLPKPMNPATSPLLSKTLLPEAISMSMANALTIKSGEQFYSVFLEFKLIYSNK